MIAGIAAGQMRPSGGGGGDPYWANVVSLLHFDGDFVDQTGASWTAYGGVSTTATNAKFGSSGAFPGVNGAYVLSAQPLNFGSDDFSFECFVRPNAAHQGTIATNRDGGSGGWLCRLEANGAIAFANIGTGQASLTTDAGAIPSLAWTHLAFSREGAVGRLFINGVLTVTGAFNPTPSSIRSVAIGSTRHDSGNYRPFNGLLDEFRITKGVARYTANFTPPTSPFPNS